MDDFGFFRVRTLRGYGPIVERGPAVVVVPLATSGRIWLAEIERPAAGTRSWELPGGAIDDEPPIDAARRELREECGLAGKRARVLPTALEPAPGMARFPHHVVVIRDVVPVGARPVPQRHEGIRRIALVTPAKLRALIAAGKVTAQPTLAALLISGVLR